MLTTRCLVKVKIFIIFTNRMPMMPICYRNLSWIARSKTSR